MRLYGYPLFGALIALSAVFAFRDEPRGSRVLYVSASAGAAILLTWMAGLSRGQSPKQVRVAVRSGRLSFGPPLAVDMAFPAAFGVVCVLAGLVWLDPSNVADFSFRERSAAYGVPLLGAFAIISALWSLGRPAGLTLTEQGIRGVRGGPSINYAWDRVVRVAVNERRGVRSIIIATDIAVHVVPMHAVSGDAYAVATIVKYYLEHPEERGRLTKGIDAVRHVDAEVRARRYASV